jgi:formate C-acetyltransferase
MEQLLNRFQDRLNALAAAVLDDHQSIEEVIAEEFPTPLASALIPGAIAKGLDVNQGGASLNSSGIQAVGVTDVADSLHAIDQLVFREGRFSLAQIVEAMSHNFQGNQYREIHSALQAVPKFGDDASAEAAHWVNRTLEIYVKALANVPNPPRGGIYAAGYYALNVNDMYGKKTPALPSGRLAGTPLANSVTPHYGMASGDLLSALNSVASVDFATYAPNGTTVTFTIDSALFPGSEGRKNLAALFKTFFQKGGMQFQPNVLNRQILLDAYQNPEKYPHLLVRVAGYCAYFNHLSDDLKKIIINRTCYGPTAQP